jgi:hypothetical protein
VYLVSLVQGDVQCSGRTLDSVRSQSAYGLICCIYLFETVNSEVKSSSNGLHSATVSDNWKNVPVSNPTSVQPRS